MMYKFSKRRQKVWLRNLNKSLRVMHDTGSIADYRKHFDLICMCERHPKVFRRLDYKRTNVRTVGTIAYAEEVYYLKN